MNPEKITEELILKLQSIALKNKKQIASPEQNPASRIIGQPSPKIRHYFRPKRKLLILDMSGILAEFVPFEFNNEGIPCPVPYFPRGRCPDKQISCKSIFRRPFLDEFLKFCFQNFDLALWSCRTNMNFEKFVDFIFGDYKHQLIFSWDQRHCTDTGIDSPGQSRKYPLFLKELSRVWKNEGSGIPFPSGYYNKSNTLLLCDCPYRSLRNPLYNAIFPLPYSAADRDDNSLGKWGDLRTFLEGLVISNDVPQYVKEKPFGLPAVTESDPYWPLIYSVAKHEG